MFKIGNIVKYRQDYKYRPIHDPYFLVLEIIKNKKEHWQEIIKGNGISYNGGYPLYKCLSLNKEQKINYLPFDLIEKI
jgi:hypothetical protein